MQLPRLKDSEYRELVLAVEDTETYWLQIVEPDVLLTTDWDQPVRRGLTVQYLNVAVPHQYRNPQGYLLVILPIGDPTSYDMLDAIWPADDRPFAYIIRENIYDDLDETGIYFRYGTDEEDGNRRIPPFSLADWRSH